ncbi:MAG TPA: sulfotransferase, partial [Gammaproteobacteria bacterium]
NLGSALQFVGDFAGAEAAYRRALAADPDYHRAWSALAQVAHAPFSPEEVAELVRRLERASLDPAAELHLCHALAKQLEDEGRYADAFRYLERGKRRCRPSLGYTFEADRALFEAARRTAGGGGAAGFASTEPIFVVGMPRTGTTLVDRILSSHPDVFSAGELGNFALAVKQAAATPSSRVLDEATLAAAAGADPAAIGRAYVESTRPRTGRVPRFVDKMPLNFFYVGLIRRALPKAKIVCLRRNPLDACLSNYRQLFPAAFSYYNYAYDLLDTGRYYIEFDALARLWRETASGDYLEVRYEDLVEHTEREVRRLLDFCELDWHPACLAFERNPAPVATASAVQVRRPIYRTAVERWRKYERELEPLRKLLGGADLL